MSYFYQFYMHFCICMPRATKFKVRLCPTILKDCLMRRIRSLCWQKWKDWGRATGLIFDYSDALLIFVNRNNLDEVNKVDSEYLVHVFKFSFYGSDPEAKS